MCGRSRRGCRPEDFVESLAPRESLHPVNVSSGRARGAYYRRASLLSLVAATRTDRENLAGHRGGRCGRCGRRGWTAVAQWFSGGREESWEVPSGTVMMAER